MLIIPAIDLKNGKCVRLKQGNMDQETIFSDDPVEVIKRWRDQGARRLHIVDLDGATSGKPVNHKVINRMVLSCEDMAIQVGGGIRNEETIQSYLDIGVSLVILGTKAVTSPHFVSDACLEFPNHIIVGLDVRDGKVATDGWSKLSKHDALDIAKGFEADGVNSIIFTDIGRDGMLSGVNVEATAKFASQLTVPVIASGGVSSLDDIKSLCAVSEEGVAGVVVGRAIYEGRVNLAEAQAIADKVSEQQ